MPRASGRIQICKKCSGSADVGLNSLCWMPVPALIRCTSPAGITLRVPRLSRCSTLPSSTYVMISMSRCGCVPNPLPGATWSSLRTRSTENPFSFGSKYSPNEKLWRLFSQSSLVSPRSEALRTLIIRILLTRLHQATRDVGDVTSLELRDLQFVLRGLTTAVGIRQRRCTVWAPACDLAHVRHSSRRVRHADDDHAEMEQRRMK